VQPNEAADCNLKCYLGQDRLDLMVFDVLVDRACTGVEAAQKRYSNFPA